MRDILWLMGCAVLAACGWTHVAAFCLGWFGAGFWMGFAAALLKEE